MESGSKEALIRFSSAASNSEKGAEDMLSDEGEDEDRDRTETGAG